MRFMQVWTVVAKDLRLIVRDRYALVLLLGMPFTITAILCFSAHEFASTLRLKELRLAIVVEDDTPWTRRLIEALSVPGVRIQQVKDHAAAERKIHQEGWTAGLSIGPGFGRRIEDIEFSELLDLPRSRLIQGIEGFDIEIISSEIRRVEGLLASQFVFSKVLQLVYASVLDRAPLVRSYLNANPARVPSRDSGLTLPTFLQISSQRLYLLIVPAQAVLFAFFLVNIMARSFIAERSSGTIQRLYMAPLSRPMLLIGKTVPFFLMSVLQGALLFAGGWAIFGMPLGERPWLLLPVIVFTSLAATALGLLIGVSVGTDYQVNVLATFLVLFMAGISGCLMPREFIPDLLRNASLVLTPHAWSLMAYEELLVNPVPDAWRVAVCCGLLLVFALLFSGFSLWRMDTSRISP